MPAMSFTYLIRAINLKSGRTLSLGDRDTVVVVGPNNSGKTTMLREVSGLLVSRGQRLLVESIEGSPLGGVKEFVQWVDERAPHVRLPDGRSVHRGMGFEVDSEKVERLFPSSLPMKPEITPLLSTFLDTRSRLNTVLEAPAIHPIREKPSLPLQLLQIRPEIEKRLSEAFRRAFGSPLSLNRSAMKTLSLVIGNAEPIHGEDAGSAAYIQRVHELPALDSQGDGMKSFVITALSTITGAPLVFLDEPEAFLHPPQARLIGSVLASRNSGQMFIATHSGDVLRGMLDSEKTVHILRITRDERNSFVHELGASDVRTMWDDPVLRFSNLLDGIFHDLVILCESDADCRFYRAILDAISEPGTAIPMFAACGGKDRMHVAARALRAVGVKTRAICDFDMLRDGAPLRSLVDALGGQWESVSELRSSLASSILAKSRPLDVAEIAGRLSQVSASPPPTIDALKTAVESVFRSASPWSAAKRSGLASIPNGQETEVAARLLDRLSVTGVFIVPVGELERFVPSASGHGPAWMAEVAMRSAEFASGAEFASAREFVAKVISASDGDRPLRAPNVRSPYGRATGRVGAWLQRSKNRAAWRLIIGILLVEFALAFSTVLLPQGLHRMVATVMTLLFILALFPAIALLVALLTDGEA